MDPQDPKNPGGLQAKSGGKEGGKKPGKVAGTDHYGQGGPDAKGSVPGKHSGTEHLPDGQNGDSKAALNAGKFGGGAGNQTPPVQPKGKEVATPVKAKKQGGPAPKVNTGALGKKSKGAAEPKLNGAQQAHVNHTPTAVFHAPAAEPPKMLDIPDVAAPQPVVVTPPAKGKVDPTHEQLRAQVATVSGLIKSSHDEILAVSKQLQQQIAGQLDTYAASIDQKVTAGVQRVGDAYDGVGKAITDAGTHANEEITKREKSIPDTIKAARDKKAGEIKNHVNDAKLAAHQKVTQGPQVTAAKAAALQFANNIKAQHAALELKIKTDTSPGGAIAGQLNPKKYSAQVQQPGAGARAVGLQALAEDKRLALITTQANAALKFVKSVLDPKEEAYRSQSGIIIQESLGAADKDLDNAVAQHEPEQKKQLDDAADLATKTLHKQVETQRAGIATTQKQATTKLAQDRKAAEDGAHKAGKTLSDDVKHGSKEIQNQLAKKAAQDAGSYSKLTVILQQLGQSKKLDEPTKAKLEAIKAQLEQAHGENKKTLEELATSGLTKLRSAKEQQFEQAIQTYEGAAAKTKTDLVNTIGTSTTELGKSFDSIGTSFDSTVTKAKEKLKIELDFYATNSETVPATYATGLDKQLTNVVAGLSMTADKMLEPMKFQEKLDKESEPAIKAAMKSGPEDAQGLWDAMDGIGTDENKIYGILRKATPGEIVFIEGCYNDAYSKRGTDKYPSPLRADLDDELSGTEWDIAFAYLRHEREKALTLELNNSTHWYNDEEDRIEDVLRAASEDEMKNLVSSPDGKAAIANVKSHLGDCDLDVVETLTNTDIPFADRKVQADAIRVYDAMYGGITGIGTDEAKIKQKLEACKTKEERQALHDAYNAYIAKKDPLKVAELKEQSKGKDIDLMDASFDDEMSGGEWTYTRALSETKLDDKEHDATVKMAKLIDGAQGGGTDEDKMYESLEDEEYAKEYAAAKPEDRPGLAKEHEKKLNARLEYLSKNGMMTSSFDNKKDNQVANVISGEMGDSSITFEELIERKWADDKEKRGDKAGKPITDIANWQSAARAEMLNLEQMVAQRTLQAGRAEPELKIAYACWGVTGTDEDTLKKALKNGGEVRSKQDIFKLREAFFKAWGVDMMEGSNELDRKDFKEPKGVVPSELDGKDWLEVRISLMGKPTTPAEIGYVDNVRYRFVTTGTGSPSPFSHAREDMEVNHNNLQAKVAEAKDPNEKIVKDEPDNEPGVITAVAQKPDAKDPKAVAEPKAPTGKTTSDPGGINSASYLEGNRLEILAGYAEKSEMAFLEAKEAMANAIITVVEIIGAALITAASMGASSPMLVMFIGNLILSGMTIMMRKDMVGDAYGAEDMGIDAIKAVVMAAIAAAGEAKVVSDFAGKAGKLAGKAWDVFAGGAEKAGMKVVGQEGLAVAEGAAKKLTTEVTSAAKNLGTKEAENVATKEVANTAEKVGTKEATNTAEKVGTKEATNTAEKVGTKEAVNTVEKAGTKEATSAAEKGIAKEGAEQAAAKEGAEQAAAKQVAKKTARDHFVNASTAGAKNALTTVMSDSANFLMDEKTYDLKFWDALFGENGIGATLLKAIPSAFAQGAMQDYIQGMAGAKGPEYLPHTRSGSEAFFRSIISEVGGTTAGFFTNLDNYQDASTFWINLLKADARAVASGGFNGIAGHAMRAKALAHEFAEGHKAGDSHEAMAKLIEALGYMKPEELSNLANHVAQMNPAAVDELPPEIKKYVHQQSIAGGAVTAPDGTSVAKAPAVADEKKAPVVADEKKAPVVADEKKAAPVTDENKAAPVVADEKKVAPVVDEKHAAAANENEKKTAVVDEKPKAPEGQGTKSGAVNAGAEEHATTTKPRTAEEIAARKEEVAAAREATRKRDEEFVGSIHSLAPATGEMGPDNKPKPVDVPKVFEAITLGGGFAAVSNKSSHPVQGDEHIMIAAGGNPWDKASNRFGQPVGESEVPGHKDGHGMKDTASEPDARFMKAAEHAENVALNRNDQQMKTYSGQAGAPEPVNEHWPEWAVKAGAKVRIPVIGEDGQLRYFYTKGVDVAVGPGGPRNLKHDVLDPTTLEAMKKGKAFFYGDQSFTGDEIKPGDDVVNYGGGASAAWGTEASSKNAGNVDWVARNAGDQKSPELQQKVTELREKVKQARASGDAEKIKVAEKELSDFTFKEAERNGHLPRNTEAGGAFDPAKQQENGGNINRFSVDDCKKIEYVEVDGKMKVKLTFVENYPDGPKEHVVYKDKMVLSIGQDATTKGGPVDLVKHYKNKLVPIFGETQPDGFTPVIGVQSPDGALRVMGAAATPNDISELLDNKVMTAKEHQDNLAAQAAKLPKDSKGVVGGFALAQKHIEDANARLGDMITESAAQQRKDVGLPATVVDEHGKTKSATDEKNPAAPTKSGADEKLQTAAGKGAGDKEEKHAENGPHVDARAKAAVAGMDEHTRQKYEALHKAAENDGQRALLDRAIAAGHSVDEIHGFALQMRGMSADEVNKNFTGQGVIQFYHQTCVVAAYQIALADVDPMYAMHLRNNPKEVMQEQRDVAVERGGMASKRRDMIPGKEDRLPGAVKEMVTDDPTMAKAVQDPASYHNEGDRGGIEATQMVGSKLHEQLEKSTGAKYEVITNDALTFTTKGQGTYGGGLPHDRIAAAIDAGLPVLFGTGGHQRTIIGREVQGGEIYYIVRDPHDGGVSKYSSSIIELMGSQSFTLPKISAPEHAATNPGESTSPTSEHPTTSASTKTGAPPDPTRATKVLDDLAKGNPKAAERLRAAGFEGVLANHEHVMTYLENGGDPNALQNFGTKTKLPLAESTRLLDKLLMVEPTANVRDFTTMAVQFSTTKKSCTDLEAIEAAINLAGLPQYKGKPAQAADDLRRLINDNVDLRVAMQEMVGTDLVESKPAGKGDLGPDLKMKTGGGQTIGREMQAIGDNMAVPATADDATARDALTKTLNRAVRDKALDYNRAAVPDYDSQEIVIQVRPSADKYNFDKLITPELCQSAIDRAFKHPDLDKARNKRGTAPPGGAAAPAAPGGAPTPAKLPDRVVIYDSLGNKRYEYTP